MHPYDEMKAYVGFTPADEVLLRGLWPHLEPRIPEVVERFYTTIAASPARAVLRDDAQLARLKVTLAEWMSEMLQGPWDLAYYERRERIGRRHVQVKLPSRFMYTAMSVVRNAMCNIAHELTPPERAHDFCIAIDKITSIDLAIMTGTYIEHQQREELATLQELIVRHLPSNVALVDAELRVTAATRASFSAADTVGMPWELVFPSPLLPALSRAVDRARDAQIEAFEPRVDVEVDGVNRTYRLTVVPVEHPLARYLIHVEDLTEAVEIEGRMRRTESLANLGALSAAVAHELRNPLAGISAAIQVIARSMPPEDRRKAVMEKIEGQIKRLDALSSDLLAFARPDTARPVRVNLEERVRVAAATVLEPFPEVQLETRGSGRGWADPDLLNHLLANLLQNAAQAMEGKGRIVAEIQEGHIHLSDSGPGIPEAIRGEVFKPFFTTRTRGTGLGLAIVAKAAAAMGVSVQLSRGSLPGAAFAIRLPTERR